MRVYALRGATTVTVDERDAILTATDELMRELLSRNDLKAEDLVSCLFTLTLQQTGEITGGTILPGFSVPIAEFFAED